MRMTWQEAQFWLECVAYEAELAAEAVQEGGQKEVHGLDDLVKILPKAE